MKSTIEIRGGLLARNTLLNFIGQVIPLAVGLVTIPYIVHGLGAERFGILSLAWVILGYFSLFDLGLGRATTKFVAEALGKGENQRIPAIVWTSLCFVLILALIGWAVLIAVTPLLVGRVLNVPYYLIEETKLVFYIMGGSLVIALATATLSGVLEAYQRFDLINTLKIPSNILTYLIPLIALFGGAGLPAIVILLLIKNLLMLVVYFLYTSKIMPSSKCFLVDFKVASSLFYYGWWIALHNAAVAILLYLDRFMVGAFLGISMLTYYAVPYELVSRLTIIPSSMMMVLFPAFGVMEAVDKQKLREFFNKAFKYVFLIMGLLCSTLIIFSKEILSLWLGSDFAEKSSVILRILSIGVFFSSLAWINGTLLQGISHPEIVSIIHIIQVPVYILSTWYLIKAINIEGAALSWTFRIVLTLSLLWIFCWKLGFFKPTFFRQSGILKSSFILSIILGIIMSIKSFIPYSAINLLLLFLVFITLTLIVTWKHMLDQSDRDFVMSTIIRIRHNFKKTNRGGN